MAVERLKVRNASATPYACMVDESVVQELNTGDVADTGTSINLIHDICPETAQIPKTTLP